MWIKICGNTNLEDAQQAAAVGAHALGLVFAPSPRQVTAAQVKAIVGRLPSSVETYGVFLDATADEIARIVAECGLNGVQLHHSSNALQASPLAGVDQLATLRQTLRLRQAEAVRIIAALAFNAGLKAQLEQASQHADAVLVDSRPSGGTGLQFDWNAASAAFRQARGHAHVIAAGGLNPENVAEAIAMLQPWGVDVVTGVESSPGRKDHARVEAFVKTAMLQFRHLQMADIDMAVTPAGAART